jgi:hypothetical protein
MFWEVLSETGTFLGGLAALLGVSLASKKNLSSFQKNLHENNEVATLYRGHKDAIACVRAI